MHNTDLIGFYHDEYIYDRMSGRLFSVSKDIYNEIKNAFVKGDAFAFADGSEYAEIAKGMIEEKQKRGVLTNTPLSDFYIPKIDKISDIEIGEITFEVTEECNLRCSYCYYDSDNSLTERRSHGSHAMGLELAQAAVDYFAPKMKTNTAVGFYGGEPMLNTKLIRQILQRIRAARPDWRGLVTITTNFTVYNRDVRTYFLILGFNNHFSFLSSGFIYFFSKSYIFNNVNTLDNTFIIGKDGI